MWHQPQRRACLQLHLPWVSDRALVVDHVAVHQLLADGLNTHVLDVGASLSRYFCLLTALQAIRNSAVMLTAGCWRLATTCDTRIVTVAMHGRCWQDSVLRARGTNCSVVRWTPFADAKGNKAIVCR